MKIFSRQSREDRDFEKCRSRFGMTDAERNEEARRAKLTRNLWQLAVVFLLALYAVGKLNA